MIPAIYKARLREGECLQRNPNKPIIAVIGRNRYAYIWIGNDAPGDMFCFATLSGPIALRKLAQAILRAIDVKAKNRTTDK